MGAFEGDSLMDAHLEEAYLQTYNTPHAWACISTVPTSLRLSKRSLGGANCLRGDHPSESIEPTIAILAM